MLIFCINMDRSVDRWERMKEYFFRDDLIRVPAVDANDWCSGEVDDTGRPIWDGDTEQEKIDAGVLHRNHSVIPGELACALSHSLIWKKMIDKDIEQAIILEDDVRPVEPYEKPISETVEFADGVDMSLLSGADKSYNFGDDICRPCVKIGKEDQLFFAHGTYGYAITKKAAKIALESIRPLAVPLPHQLYTSIVEDYRQMYPIRDKFETNCNYSSEKIKATAQRMAIVEVSKMDDISLMTPSGKKTWRTK